MSWLGDKLSWVGGELSAGYNAAVEGTGNLLYKGAKLVGISDDAMTKKGTTFSRMADAGQKVQKQISSGNVVGGVATGACAIKDEALRPVFNVKSEGADDSRPLTEGEIKLARSVFGNSIDYSKVRLHNSTYLPACAQGDNIITPNGELYCGKHYCDDFSKTGSGYQHLFMHEMTHVWQYQNNVVDPRMEAFKTFIAHGGKYTDAYDYKADPKKDLLDYNFEQQADIVADNFIARQKPADQRTQEDNDRAAVLKNFTRNPSYAAKLSWGQTIMLGIQQLHLVPGMPF